MDIFSAKNPANNAIELNKLNKINSKRIYYNFNFRFSKIAKILRHADKYNLVILFMLIFYLVKA